MSQSEDDSGDEIDMSGFEVLDELSETDEAVEDDDQCDDDGEGQTESSDRARCDTKYPTHTPSQDTQISATTKIASSEKAITTAALSKSKSTGMKTPTGVQEKTVTSTVVKTTSTDGKTATVTVKPKVKASKPSTTKTTSTSIKQTPASMVKSTPVKGKSTPATGKPTPLKGGNITAATKNTSTTPKITPATGKGTPTTVKSNPTAVKSTPAAMKSTPSTAKNAPTPLKTTAATPNVTKTTSAVVKTMPATTPKTTPPTPSTAKNAPTPLKTTADTPNVTKTTPTVVKTMPASTPKTKPPTHKMKITSPAVKTPTSVMKSNTSIVKSTDTTTDTAAFPTPLKTTPISVKKTSSPASLQVSSPTMVENTSNTSKSEKTPVTDKSITKMAASIQQRPTCKKAVVRLTPLSPSTTTVTLTSADLVTSAKNAAVSVKTLPKSTTQNTTVAKLAVPKTVTGETTEMSVATIPKTTGQTVKKPIPTSQKPTAVGSKDPKVPVIVKKVTPVKTTNTVGSSPSDGKPVAKSPVSNTVRSQSMGDLKKLSPKPTVSKAQSTVTVSSAQAKGSVVSGPQSVKKVLAQKPLTTTTSAATAGKRVVVKAQQVQLSKEAMMADVISRSLSTQTPRSSEQKGKDDLETTVLVKQRLNKKQERQHINRLKTVMIHPVQPNDLADPIMEPIFQNSHCVSARFLCSRKGVEKKGHLEVRYFSEEDARKYAGEMMGLTLASGKHLSAKILGHCGPFDGNLDDWEKLKMAEQEGLANGRCVYVHQIPPQTEEHMLHLLFPDMIGLSLHLPEENRQATGHALLEFPTSEIAETVADNSKNYETRIGNNVLQLSFIGQRSLKTEAPSDAEKKPEETKNKRAKKRPADSKDDSKKESPKKVKKEEPEMYKGQEIHSRMKDIKVYLFQWSLRKHTAPVYSFSSAPTGKGNQLFTCEVRIKGVDYVGKATETTKKSAQKKAAYDFVQYLIKEDLVPESSVQKCKDELIRLGYLQDPNKPEDEKPKPRPDAFQFSGYDVKDLLWHFCTFSRKNMVPQFKYQAWGPPHKKMFRSELFLMKTLSLPSAQQRQTNGRKPLVRMGSQYSVRVQSFPYIGRGTNRVKRGAQNMAAYDFVLYLIKEGYLKDSHLEMCKQDLIKQGLLEDPDKPKTSRRSPTGGEESRNKDRRGRSRERSSAQERRRSKEPERAPRFSDRSHGWSRERPSPARKSSEKKEDTKNVEALKDEITRQLAELQEGRVSDPNKLEELAKKIRSDDSQRDPPVSGRGRESRKRRDSRGRDSWQDRGGKVQKVDTFIPPPEQPFHTPVFSTNAGCRPAAVQGSQQPSTVVRTQPITTPGGSEDSKAVFQTPIQSQRSWTDMQSPGTHSSNYSANDISQSAGRDIRENISTSRPETQQGTPFSVNQSAGINSNQPVGNQHLADSATSQQRGGYHPTLPAQSPAGSQQWAQNQPIGIQRSVFSPTNHQMEQFRSNQPAAVGQAQQSQQVGEFNLNQETTMSRPRSSSNQQRGDFYETYPTEMQYQRVSYENQPMGQDHSQVASDRPMGMHLPTESSSQPRAMQHATTIRDEQTRLFDSNETIGRRHATATPSEHIGGFAQNQPIDVQRSSTADQDDRIGAIETNRQYAALTRTSQQMGRYGQNQPREIEQSSTVDKDDRLRGFDSNQTVRRPSSTATSASQQPITFGLNQPIEVEHFTPTGPDQRIGGFNTKPMQYSESRLQDTQMRSFESSESARRLYSSSSGQHPGEFDPNHSTASKMNQFDQKQQMSAHEGFDYNPSMRRSGSESRLQDTQMRSFESSESAGRLYSTSSGQHPGEFDPNHSTASKMNQFDQKQQMSTHEGFDYNPSMRRSGSNQATVTRHDSTWRQDEAYQSDQEYLKKQLISSLKDLQDGRLVDNTDMLTKLAEQLLVIQGQEPRAGMGTQTGPQPGSQESKGDGKEEVKAEAPKIEHAKIREQLLIRMQSAGIHSGTLNKLVSGLKTVQNKETAQLQAEGKIMATTDSDKPAFRKSSYSLSVAEAQRIKMQNKIKRHQMNLKMARAKAREREEIVFTKMASEQNLVTTQMRNKIQQIRRKQMDSNRRENSSPNDRWGEKEKREQHSRDERRRRGSQGFKPSAMGHTQGPSGLVAISGRFDPQSDPFKMPLPHGSNYRPSQSRSHSQKTPRQTDRPGLGFSTRQGHSYGKPLQGSVKPRTPERRSLVDYPASP